MGRLIVETRVCPICGKEFGINCYQTRKVYCDACKEQHYIDDQKEYREKNREKLRAYGRLYGMETYKAKTYTCSLCGKKFSPGTGGKCKYCIECLWERRYEKPYRQYLFRRKEYKEINKR